MAIKISGSTIIDDGRNIGSAGIITATTVSAAGSITAATLYGDGSSITGIDATKLKDNGGTTRVKANTNGAVVTGIITATSFSGDGIISSGIVTGPAFAGHSYIQAPFGTTQNFSTTVATKTSAHRYNGLGSSNGYVIDGVEAPFLTLTPGRTYRFTLSASDMTNHPFRFYEEADKTTAYTSNVTSTATYTEITVTDTTPEVLHYQCSAHDYMGNAVNTNTDKNSSSIQCGILSVTQGNDLGGYKVEDGSITNSSVSGTFDYYLENGHIQKIDGTSSSNYGPNFKVSASKTFDSIMDLGDVATMTLMVESSSHYLLTSNIKIDDSTSGLDIDYVGGSAPDSANGSGYDIYTFTIQKTSSTPNYHIIVNAMGAN